MSNPKVIILAAGEGSRLRPYTNDCPKCLVPYQGRPLLDRTLESFNECGLNEVVIVGGYRAEDLRSRANRLYINSEYQTTNMVTSLFCAERELEGDIIISYGDITYRPRVVQKLLQSREQFSVVVDRRWKELWEQRMDDPISDLETLKLSPEGFIVEIGNKPKSESEIQGQYIGLIKISSEMVERVKEFYRSMDREKLYRSKSFTKMDMTTFIQQIIEANIPVYAVPIDGGWIEVDAPRDLECKIVE